MTRSAPIRRRTARKTQLTQLTPGALLLAGLGAVSLGRKQAIQSIDELATSAKTLRASADSAVRDAGTRVSKLGKQAKARIAPVKKQAAAFAKQAQATVQTRLSPVLVKLGVKPAKAKRAVRTVKRSPRPVAKRA